MEHRSDLINGEQAPKAETKIRSLPSRVPMDEYKDKVIEVVTESPSSVIIGETGSGKTTRIPAFLMEAFSDAKIAITQPRRVAARSVSRYVAQCAGVELGTDVGYQVRFDDRTNEGTRATFMTDGVLLRDFQKDPMLLKYDVVMVDEAHERNLNIDFVLGLLKKAQKERVRNGERELKIIVTSATIEKSKFTEYFDGAPSVDVPGRMYPMDVHYEENSVGDYTKAAAEKAQHIMNVSKDGDILIFMPGEVEIRKTVDEIKKTSQAILCVHKRKKSFARLSWMVLRPCPDSGLGLIQLFAYFSRKNQ